MQKSCCICLCALNKDTVFIQGLDPTEAVVCKDEDIRGYSPLTAPTPSYSPCPTCANALRR